MPTTEYGKSAIELTRALIERASITPDDAGCQMLMMERLKAIGFECEPMQFAEVENFWATRAGSEPEHGPILVFAGHTDVVPTGPVEQWQSPPFEATEHNGYLYGRGAADMKASLAAMVVATEAFVKEHPQYRGRIAFLITADEEGPSVNGTTRVVDCLEERGERLDWCIVGEPSSTEHLGDTVKNGRRGSLGASLTVHGRQGHIAYPALADNPIHSALRALDRLTQEHWDDGNAFFAPTSLQFSNINGGTGATNVIPGTLHARFNIRFSTEVTDIWIRQRCEEILQDHGLNFDIEWQLSGQPFITEPGALVNAARDSILEVTGLTPTLSTGGGTSDGRFITRIADQILELGPVNASIHQINEHVKIDDIPRLTKIYHGIMQRLLVS